MLMDSLRENADQLGIVLPLGGPNVERDDPSLVPSSHFTPPPTLPPTFQQAAQTRLPNPAHALFLRPDPVPMFTAPTVVTNGTANAIPFAPNPLVFHAPFQQQQPFGGLMFDPFQPFMKYGGNSVCNV